MKKIILIVTFLIANFGFAQTGILTPVDRLKIKTPQELSGNTQVVTRSTTTGETGYVAKTDLIDYNEYTTASALPVTGTTGKIYLTKDDNKLYRWNGTVYTLVSDTDISGKQNTLTAGTNITIDNTIPTAPVISSTSPLPSTTITDGVTTTSPNENVVFDALATKQATLVSATNIKTVNGTTLLGSGNLSTTPTLQQVLDYNHDLANGKNFQGMGAGNNTTFSDNLNAFGVNAGANATNAWNSNFIGYYAASGATASNYTNALGYYAASGATASDYCNLLGMQVGKTFSGNNIGANNIIIGTNISLPNAAANRINLGGVIYGFNTNSDVSGDPKIVATSTGRVAIGSATDNGIDKLQVNGSAISTFYRTNYGTNSINLLTSGQTAQTADRGIMIGTSTFNNASYLSTSIGSGTTIGTGAGNVTIGYGANASNGGLAISSNIYGSSSTGGIAINGYVGSSGLAIWGTSSNANALTIGGTASGSQSMAVGSASSATGYASLALGDRANSGHGASTAIGILSTTTANNQLVAGSSLYGYGIDEVFIGHGVVGNADENGVGTRFNASGGNGTNKNGGHLTIAGGKGTGTGIGGDVIFSTSTPTTTGTTLQTLTERAKIDGNTGDLILAKGLTLTTTPTTSAGGYDVLTRNSATGVIEKTTISGGGSGTVTNVSVTTANGISGTVATPSTTPAITLSMQDATTSQSGQLTSTDWNIFNGKQNTTITVRKISSATTLSNSDNGTVILLTASCTVTLPNGLMSGFNCSFATQTGAVMTYSLGGSVTLINNTATVMGERSTHTIVQTATANEYLTVDL